MIAGDTVTMSIDAPDPQFENHWWDRQYPKFRQNCRRVNSRYRRYCLTAKISRQDAEVDTNRKGIPMQNRHTSILVIVFVLLFSHCLCAQEDLTPDDLKDVSGAGESASLEDKEVEVPRELLEKGDSSTRRTTPTPLARTITPSARLSLSADERFPEMKQHIFSNQPELPVFKDVYWASDNFCHLNLLFEQHDLEQHGLVRQPRYREVLYSSAHFFGRGIVLPWTTLRGSQLDFHKACGGR